MTNRSRVLASRVRSRISALLHNLRARLALSHLAVILVTILVASFSLLSLVQGYLWNSLEQSLTAEAQLLARTLFPESSMASPPTGLSPAYNAMQQQAGNLSVQLGSKSPSQDSEIAAELAQSNLGYLANTTVQISTALETHIQILDSRGVVLVDSAMQNEGVNLSAGPAIAAALEGRRQSSIENAAGQDWLFVAVPIWVEERVAGVIYIGQPLRDVASILRDVRTRLLLSAAVALPISALLALVLARGISRPIAALTKASERLAAGNFDYPLQSAGKDELATLTRSFDRMRQELQSTERLRSQFVSDVSHELRTPLTAIKGLIETLQDGAADDPTVRDRFLASIEAETDRLIRLVNDLLTLSRADALAFGADKENLDLHRLAATTAQKFTARAAACGVLLRVDFTAGELKAPADADRIEQVLFNLLDNALKHTPPGGTISVTGHHATIEGGACRLIGPDISAEGEILSHSALANLPNGKWAILRITDTGAGIPAADLPHVFERFYRSDRARSRQRGGSGLGLSIAKALVEAHGGHIWLESPAQGTDQTDLPGTAASFAIPLSA
jgi:two-component system sensor histidine kinase BaeS